MEISVDRTRCDGLAQCCGVAPEVFQIEDGLLIVESDPPDELADRIRVAEHACPMQAIMFRE